MFDFQGPGLKVKVTVTIFRKTLSSLYCLHLSMDFNITSYKCWVLKYLEQDRPSMCLAQGQGHCGYF